MKPFSIVDRPNPDANQTIRRPAATTNAANNHPAKSPRTDSSRAGSRDTRRASGSPTSSQINRISWQMSKQVAVRQPRVVDAPRASPSIHQRRLSSSNHRRRRQEINPAASSPASSASSAYTTCSRAARAGRSSTRRAAFSSTCAPSVTRRTSIGRRTSAARKVSQPASQPVCGSSACLCRFSERLNELDERASIDTTLAIYLSDCRPRFRSQPPLFSLSLFLHPSFPSL